MCKLGKETNENDLECDRPKYFKHSKLVMVNGKVQNLESKCKQQNSFFFKTIFPSLKHSLNFTPVLF